MTWVEVKRNSLSIDTNAVTKQEEDSGTAGIIGGAVGAAAVGAIIGSILPGIGTAIGAFVGGLIGGATGIAGGSIYAAGVRSGDISEKSFENVIDRMRTYTDASGELL